MLTYYHVVLGAFCVFLIYYVDKRRSRRINPPLPPGPKPLPIIGNLLDIPAKFPWETYDQWFKQYQSDIIYVQAAGTQLVILKTHEAAVELLEKRSGLYSDRPYFPMACELMGWDFILPLLPYGDRWRKARRLFNETFNEKMIHQFEGLQTEAAHRLIKSLSNDPGDIWQRLKTVVASSMFSVTYGMNIMSHDDPFFMKVEEALEGFMAALVPGAFAVDALPWLKHIPPWFPGAGFRIQAQKWKQAVQEVLREPFESTQQKMKEENHSSSYVARNLLKLHDSSSAFYSEKDIIETAGAAFMGGFDTTKSSLFSFILAMVQFPEAQRKGQAEIDEILKGALPTFEDRESLPYVSALVKEVLRWKPVSPFGNPHLLTSDDVYQGYLIPKGSLVVANDWSMFYNEDMYPEPEKFNPDRFLKEGKLNPAVHDPQLSAFGYGRRICPGRHFAQSFIWIMCASILATMDIGKVRDEKGNVIEPSVEFEAGLVVGPKPFPCDVKPREKRAHGVNPLDSLQI